MGAPTNPRVYQTIRDKRQWQDPLEPAAIDYEQSIGSKGWHTRGYLPHYDRPGTLQLVTFRLADAMPASRLSEWKALLEIQDQREQRTKLEAYLDLGHGECPLRQRSVAAAVEEVLLRGDGQRYRLAAWVIMPNHIHVLVELWDLPLGQVMKVWKGASARAMNQLLARAGSVWQEEYWDRYIRNESHFRKARHYLEWNPVKAGLVQAPDLWAFSSANPKWQWSPVDRYAGGHLLNGPSRWSSTGAIGDSERGHSCPPRELGG
jgi:putative transposase